MKPVPAELFRELILTVRPQSRTTITLTGRSMLPTMRHGDELLVDPPCGLPRVGDVVVFPHRGLLVAHRVIERGRRALVCAGDASDRITERISANDVIGIVRGVRRDDRIVIARPTSFARALRVTGDGRAALLSPAPAKDPGARDKSCPALGERHARIALTSGYHRAAFPWFAKEPV